MAKNGSDFFDRLTAAGMRKKVARKITAAAENGGEGASSKVQGLLDDLEALRWRRATALAAAPQSVRRRPRRRPATRKRTARARSEAAKKAARTRGRAGSSARR